MNHLFRDLAPITDEAWTEIDAEAERSLRLLLAARRLVDVADAGGWRAGAVPTGRATSRRGTC